MSNEVAIKRKISDTIHEYDSKVENISKTLSTFEEAQTKLQSESCIGGTYGRTRIDIGSIYVNNIQESLLKSAWYNLYSHLKIDTIATAEDKKRFEQSMIDPPEFTIENIRGSFGDYIMNPFDNILRGLAEVFCDLDPAYKSHDKVKIGVKGLPKRIILTNVDGYGSWGRDRLKNVLDALASYQGKIPLTTHELDTLLKDEDALLVENSFTDYKGEKIDTPARGVRLKRFANGNGHLSFEKKELDDINKALAQYYGDVLVDCSEDIPEQKRQSTAVSKDLQYYPTPQKVVDRVVRDLYPLKGQKILEPSCGCGRFMNALRKEGANVIGYEVDAHRAGLCIQAGHKVACKNFLETIPTGDFDRVVMNPPFYGKHYAKHIEHALKFLKDGGVLTTILPVTARYDHGLVDGNWQDLPVGSFRESGTNINTCILTIRKGRAY